jgi:hypothetical protein
MNKVIVFLSLLICYSATAQVIESSVSSIDFEMLDYNNPETITIELTNLSNEEIEIEEVLLFDIYESSPFQVIDLPNAIPANGTVMLEVLFDPVHNIEHNTEMIIKTSGNRGALAVDLKGACDYPGDYYDDTFDEIDGDLKEVLNDVLADGQITYDYGSARDEMYMIIDNQRLNGQGSAQNRLTRVYIGTDAVGYSSRQDAQNNYGMNTEHTFPQGNFNSNLPMVSDVHHLFTTDVDANSTRGNLRFGNVVSNVDWSEGGSQRGFNSEGQLVFEPRDEQKGMSARAILYFLARYQNFGGHLSADMESAMKEWHFEYPPTDVDLQRNEDIFAFQGNRNPFAEYPQMVHRIFSFRSDQDRPNLGELVLSHDEADFGVVVGQPAEFNVVVANIGERFINVSEVEVGGAGFSLAEGQEDSFVIIEGESVGIKVKFDPSIAQGASSGALVFNTSLPNSEPTVVPLMADGVLGLSNLSELDIVLHPNPAQDVFRLSGETEGIQTVELFDMQGREVKAYANPSVVYPLESVSTGIYLVKVIFKNGKTGIQRLAVNR